MTRPAGLRRLATAAELCLDRERLALQRIDEASAALRAAADELRRAGPDGSGLLAFRGEAAGQIASWETLRDGRLIEIGHQLAALAAEREDARWRVARACGRVIAIRRLGGG